MSDDGLDSRPRLCWVQPDRQGPLHELRDESGGVRATLTEDRTTRVPWGTRDPRRAAVAAGSGRWEFSIQRQGLAGWLGLSATVHIAGSNRGHLAVGPFLRSGHLLLAATPPILWDERSPRAGGARFLTAMGEPLIAFRSGLVARSVATLVEVEPAGAALSYRYLLIALGRYLELLAGHPFR